MSSDRKSKHAFIEVKCPDCRKQFNSEEEMLKHYDEQHDVKEGEPHKKMSHKKVLLTVAIIAILIIITFAFLINLTNTLALENAIKTRDSDGDGITDWTEINVYHTNPYKIDTSGLGLDDFNAIYTYGINPNNQTAVKEFLNNLPNVTALYWNLLATGANALGGWQHQEYLGEPGFVNISLRDPLIKYLVSRSEIRWSTWTSIEKTSGSLYVDGSPAFNNYTNQSVNILAGGMYPAYFFTHGRNGMCGDSQRANFVILTGMGYKTVRVSGMSYGSTHGWCETLINGTVYIVNYNGVFVRGNYYERNSNALTPVDMDSNDSVSVKYDPNWYLK